MDLSFGGAVTIEDLRRAQRLAIRSQRVVVLICAVVVMLALLLLLTTPDPWSLSTLTIVLPLVLFVVFFWVMLRWQVKRVWQDSAATLAVVSGRVTDDAVTYNTTNSESTMRWSLYGMYRASPEIVLLYQNRMAYNVFPRHLFRTDDDWNAFNQIVHVKLGSNR